MEDNRYLKENPTPAPTIDSMDGEKDQSVAGDVNQNLPATESPKKETEKKTGGQEENDPTDDKLYKGLSLETFIKYTHAQMKGQEQETEVLEKDYVLEVKESKWKSDRDKKMKKVYERRKKAREDKKKPPPPRGKKR